MSSENAVFQAVRIYLEKTTWNVTDSDLRSILEELRYECMTPEFIYDVVLQEEAIAKSAELQVINLLNNTMLMMYHLTVTDISKLALLLSKSL